MCSQDCTAPGGEPANGFGENVLLRAPRIRKLFRVLQLVRMLKVIKLAKNKEQVSKNMNRHFEVTSGYERLVVCLGSIIYMIHVLACLWIFVGREGRLFRDGWLSPEM
jgi:hypothetical protein